MLRVSKIQKINRIKLLKRAFQNKSTHIPSALSMIDYFYWLNKQINYDTDALVIGKPYGALAYHTVWNSKNNDLITGETNNVIWADTTLGNCLGIASGLLLSSKYKHVIVNMSDAAICEGTVLEAAQFIGQFDKFKSHITLCIDCNKYACISKTLYSIEYFKNLFKTFNWNVIHINGHDDEQLKNIQLNNTNIPTCILFDTIKGFGIPTMMNNPIDWHYKVITTNELYTTLLNEINE